ncbi:MAG: zinc ribbon domain-containing protein [Anaerolineae bacterium]|nr:zinc ribbon domain-containing protein [Anaerolineae bacterium]
MSAGKTIAYIFASILIFFGVLFIWGAFGDEGGGTAWIFIGMAVVAIGFGIIWFASRALGGAPDSTSQNVTLQVDLPGDMSMEKFKCSNCGNPLSKDDIKMVAGAPTANCPYCGQVYTIAEEPKW